MRQRMGGDGLPNLNPPYHMYAPETHTEGSVSQGPAHMNQQGYGNVHFAPGPHPAAVNNLPPGNLDPSLAGAGPPNTIFRPSVLRPAPWSQPGYRNHLPNVPEYPTHTPQGSPPAHPVPSMVPSQANPVRGYSSTGDPVPPPNPSWIHNTPSTPPSRKRSRMQSSSPHHSVSPKKKQARRKADIQSPSKSAKAKFSKAHKKEDPDSMFRYSEDDLTLLHESILGVDSQHIKDFG
ncbi:hypothetical protein QCA50_012666 [Cerrena zonata]|uniref:Uncharacterized protein n=1 Tax=Cerrena zonata TaxID=2478898 RepID=A0AAW0G453_9APHY